MNRTAFLHYEMVDLLRRHGGAMTFSEVTDTLGREYIVASERGGIWAILDSGVRIAPAGLLLMSNEHSTIEVNNLAWRDAGKEDHLIRASVVHALLWHGRLALGQISMTALVPTRSLNPKKHLARVARLVQELVDEGVVSPAGRAHIGEQSHLMFRLADDGEEKNA